MVEIASEDLSRLQAALKEANSRMRALARMERALSEAREEAARRRSAERRLRAQLREAGAPTPVSDVVEGGLAGRAALESLRNVTLARMDRHLQDLEGVRDSYGRESSGVAASRGLLADFSLLDGISEPSSLSEGRRRDRVECLLGDEVLSSTLSAPGIRGDRWRTRVWAYAVRATVPAASREVFRRSAERYDRQGP
jgi:multidrug efflux pump subunit AcrA (membrane-fusion protein)